MNFGPTRPINYQKIDGTLSGARKWPGISTGACRGDREPSISGFKEGTSRGAKGKVLHVMLRFPERLRCALALARSCPRTRHACVNRHALPHAVARTRVRKYENLPQLRNSTGLAYGAYDARCLSRTHARAAGTFLSCDALATWSSRA